MQLNNFIEGLMILQAYYDKPDGYHVGAEQDIVYMYGTNKVIPETVVARLCILGWFQPEVYIAEEDDSFEPKHYDPSEGWAAYT